jgi:3-hydroxyisobutyrate dehydrogenase-like beta-hydroxyacid dehydrogenase
VRLQSRINDTNPQSQESKEALRMAQHPNSIQNSLSSDTKWLQKPRLGFIGFGEVGSIFARELAATQQFSSISAWDTKLLSPQGTAMRELMQQQSVSACQSASELAWCSDLIFSAVTAANTLAVAKDIAAHLKPGQIFLDLNSASPATKQQAAETVQANKADYVEAGVMTSVPPYGKQVPMLLGGSKAANLSLFLNQLGMDTKVVSTEIGIASAIKMCRSIMIKGLEALVIESYTTARSYGVEDYVLPTLAETFPSIDWPKQGAYFYSRVADHGKRRAEEMRESANTVLDTGFAPLMAAAIAQTHQFIADQAATGIFVGLNKDSAWQAYADALIRAKKLTF